MITHIVIPYHTYEGCRYRSYPKLFKTLWEAEEYYEISKAQNITVELMQITPNAEMSLVKRYYSDY